MTLASWSCSTWHPQNLIYSRLTGNYRWLLPEISPHLPTDESLMGSEELPSFPT